MIEFVIEVILQNRADDTDKTLKSSLVEIVRHAIESMREINDKKSIEDD